MAFLLSFEHLAFSLIAAFIMILSLDFDKCFMPIYVFTTFPKHASYSVFAGYFKPWLQNFYQPYADCDKQCHFKTRSLSDQLVLSSALTHLLQAIKCEKL